MQNIEETVHIFVVTLMERMTEPFSEYEDVGGAGYPNIGFQRSIGFFFDKDTAIKALQDREINFYESCYQYAVVEEYAEFSYERYGENTSSSLSEIWFKYNKEEQYYSIIKKPKAADMIHGIACYSH